MEWPAPAEPARSCLKKWFLQPRLHQLAPSPAPFFLEVHKELTKSHNLLMSTCFFHQQPFLVAPGLLQPSSLPSCRHRLSGPSPKQSLRSGSVLGVPSTTSLLSIRALARGYCRTLSSSPSSPPDATGVKRRQPRPALARPASKRLCLSPTPLFSSGWCGCSVCCQCWYCLTKCVHSIAVHQI